MLNLEGKKVVVIGGSSGMGLATAKAAAESGAQVFIGGRRSAALEDAVAQIGNNAEFLTVDSSNEVSVKAFFDKCGTVDHLAIPGSSVRTNQFLDTSIDDLRYSIDNKFIGQVLCVRHCQLAKQGSIVLFSGILAQRPGNSSLLGAINAAVESLAKGLAVELAPARVNVVSPGMTSGTSAYQGMPTKNREAMFDRFKKTLPTQSVGTPTDMAYAALFLMSSPFITGHTICVDGGGLCV